MKFGEMLFFDANLLMRRAELWDNGILKDVSLCLLRRPLLVVCTTQSRHDMTRTKRLVFI
jgi:hypothetical protein